jgi:hypothetical protein
MQLFSIDIMRLGLQNTSLLVGPSGILEYVWQGPASHVLHAMMDKSQKPGFSPLSVQLETENNLSCSYSHST